MYATIDDEKFQRLRLKMKNRYDEIRRERIKKSIIFLKVSTIENNIQKRKTKSIILN